MSTQNDFPGPNPNDIPTIAPGSYGAHQGYPSSPIQPVSHPSSPKSHSHGGQSFAGQSQSNELTVGSYLGPYLLQGELGRGGMGVVYQALDQQLRRVVALKVLIAGEDASDMAVARFQLEAEAVAKLGQHPNIVPVFDIGRQGRLQYFSMEFVEGRPLDQLIAGAEITPKRAATLTLGICQGLARAHDQGILHRDIKPANILIDKQGIPKITDFGLAKDLDEDSGLTQSGVTMGSPLYMSPEQANGETELIDQRSDIYSMGVALYEMLTGTPPFQGKTTLALIQKILMEEPEDPRSRNPSIDVDLASICLKSMEKERERRYQNVGEIIADLQAYLDGRPVSAKPVTQRRRLMLWIRRNRATALMSAVASLALFAALGTAVWFSWVKGIMDLRAAEQYKAETRLALKAALEKHLTNLQSEPEDEKEREELKKSVRREKVAEEVRKMAGLDQSELAETLLNESLKNYRAEPYLSQIAYIEKEYSRAYRYDPNGPWGLRAQIAIAQSFNKKRAFEKSRALLQRVLTRLPNLVNNQKLPLKTVRKMELEALDALSETLQNLGDFPQLRAVLKRARVLRDNNESEASRRLNRLLSVIGEERQLVPLGRRLPGGVGYEHFEIITLDSPQIILANRRGRPAFSLEAGRLKKLTGSPLKALPDGDFIERLRVGDFNGDGKKDLAAAVYRGGQSGIVILEEEGGDWKVSFSQIDANVRPYELITGDFDGDKKDEAFLVLKWEAGHHYLLDFKKGFHCAKIQLAPKTSPYICGGAAFDLDSDGRDELILGRPPQIGGNIEVYRVQSSASPQFAPSFNKIQSLRLGGARSFAVDEDGLIAATISVPKNVGKDWKMVEANGLSLIRWDGRLNAVKHLSFGYQHHGTMSDMGAVHRGQFAGQRVFAWRSKLYKKATPPNPSFQGLKLQFLLGDDLDHPLAISYLPGVIELALLDLDKDTNSELLILRGESDGTATIHVHGRSSSAPEAVQRAQKVQINPDPTEVLLQAAGDLIDFNDPSSLREAYSLSKELASRHERTALGDRASKLMVQAQLRLGQHCEERAEAHYQGPSYQQYPDKQSLSARKVADLQAGWSRAEELTENAKKHYRQAMSDALRLSEGSRDPDLKDSILVIGREAARRLLNWKEYQRLNGRLSDRALTKSKAKASVARLASLSSDSSLAYAGSFSDPALPLRIDFPFRAQFSRSHFNSNSKEILEAVLDNHSQRSYVGVPIEYKGGAFQFELELEVDSHPWEISLYFGVLPETSTMRPDSDPDNRVLLGHFRQPGVLRYRPDMTLPLAKSDVNVFVQGTGKTKPVLKSETGQWTFHYLYSPETETVSLSVYDRFHKRVIYRYRGRIQRQLSPGRYLFGLSMGYIHETSLRVNQLYPTVSKVRLGSFRLSGPRLSLDRAPSRKARGISQEAGAALVRGQKERAVALYQKALERDPQDVLARLHLAVLTESREILKVGLKQSPYLLALTLDDAFRGSRGDHRKVVGQLLQRLKGEFPGFCGAFLGDWAEAQAALKDDSLAHRYLRIRSRSTTSMKDLKWLRDRRLRHCGSELQELFWAPTPGRKEPSLKVLAQALNSRDLRRVFQIWVHLSRRLIVAPDDCEALFYRAIAFGKLGEYGRGLYDLRQRCQLQPRRGQIWKELADRLVPAGAYHETLSALEQALKHGVSPAVLKEKQFQVLVGNPRFQALKKGS